MDVVNMKTNKELFQCVVICVVSEALIGKGTSIFDLNLEKRSFCLLRDSLFVLACTFEVDLLTVK